MNANQQEVTLETGKRSQWKEIGGPNWFSLMRLDSGTSGLSAMLEHLQEWYEKYGDGDGVILGMIETAAALSLSMAVQYDDLRKAIEREKEPIQ